jgi:hypothetical protein
MRRTLLLAALGALAFPATAQAVTLSPEAQQLADAHNWTATDFEAEEPYAEGDDLTKSCPYGRAKRVGFNYGGQVRLSQRLKVCANNGHPTYTRCGPVRHASPGARWTNIWGPHVWKRVWSDGAGCHAEIQWKFAGVIDQYFVGRIDIRAAINGDHSIWFPRKRRIFE